MISWEAVTKAGLNAVAYDAWHDESKNPKGWHWHVSSLAGCPRAAVLQRAGLAKDGRSFKSSLTLRLGTVMHSEFERSLQAYVADPKNKAEIIVQEEGFYHKDMQLAAKPDALIQVDGKNILIDFKTEQSGCTRCNFGSAKHWRRKEQERDGTESAVKHEHRVQLAGTAMVLESNGIKVDSAQVWYYEKGSYWADEQHIVDVHDPMYIEAVEYLYGRLESAWHAYSHDAEDLPPRLDGDDKWRCTPRKEEGGPKGEYCEARSVCFAEHMPA